MHTPSSPAAQSARLMQWATYASAGTAVLLIGAKLTAWLMTDSVSLMATLIDSCLDAAASLLNLLAVRHALQPADREHRFGHGKAEALAGLGQALFIAGSALFLFVEAIDRLFHPQPPQVVEVGIAVMIYSIVATLLLLAFQRHVIAKTGSTAIKADSLHYQTDLIVNGSVIVALLLAFYGWSGFDSIFALAIAAYILYAAWGIMQESIQHLMDRELPDEQRQKIRTLALSHPKARGLHDLRTRKSGTTSFIQLHLVLDDDLTLFAAHAIGDEVEALLAEAFPDSEIIIHQDPVSAGEPVRKLAIS